MYSVSRCSLLNASKLMIHEFVHQGCPKESHDQKPRESLGFRDFRAMLF